MTQRINSNDRVLLPSSEAIKIAGFSRQHMQRLLRSGQVEGIKPGHDWLVYEDSLQAFLTQPRKPGPKGPRKKLHQNETGTSTIVVDHEDGSDES